MVIVMQCNNMYYSTNINNHHHDMMRYDRARIGEEENEAKIECNEWINFKAKGGF
jgi:hypothetical protein